MAVSRTANAATINIDMSRTMQNRPDRFDFTLSARKRVAAIR
jgi:hypothetical protein